MKIPILILSSVLMKIWQIPYVIFPNLKSVFLQILHDFSIMKYNSSVLFYIKRCILCTKGTSQSASFLDLLVLGSKFPKFLSFLKQKISFSSNFVPLFITMRPISSILFSAETLCTFSKSSLSKYKFGEISLWWALL